MTLALAVLLSVPLVPVDLVGLALTGPDGAQPRAEAAASSIVVTLGPDDWTASSPLVLEPGGDVTWRNRSGRTLAITSPAGLLDSGPIPDGGSFVASLPADGSYAWTSDVGGASIVVGGALVGDPAGPAAGAIPDLLYPPVSEDDLALHPDVLVDLPKSLALIGFTATATVAQANAALGPDWVVVGGIPEFGHLYVQTAQPLDSFDVLDEALAAWRADPAIAFASYVFPWEETVLPDPVPPLVAPPGPSEWFWEPPSVAPIGSGGNWGQEVIRAPAAWNLLEAAALDGAQGRSTTVVLDSGFADHVDLDRLDRRVLCDPGSPSVCTGTGADDHGNEVAGIIGADREAPGLNGIDPLSDLVGVVWRGSGRVGSYGSSDSALALVLRNIAAGNLGDVNVINLSIGLSPPNPALWWARYAGETCGPGRGDDAGATGTCYPSTHDATIEQYEQYAKATRGVVEAFATELADPPLLVAATGNYSAQYCRDKSVSCTGVEFPDTEPQGNLGSGFAWASDNWQSSAPDPVIAVESIGYSANGPVRDTFPERPSLARSTYSNVSGDVSAPGWTSSTCGAEGAPDTYCTSRGTSLAAPVVAGVAGLMASWDPSLTAAQLKQLIIGSAIADTTNGAAPRVDAFAPLLSLDGAARALVDVNDPSNDGNRRIAYNRDGTIALVDTVESVTEPGFSTDPDGNVDLRDFRRFRDAWLLRCLIDAEPGCPTDIDLDGQLDHPKRDLNLDGPVSLIAPAPGQPNPSEATFARFDFNGDGEVSATAVAAVPLGGGGVLTDLDVLASQLDDMGDPGFGVEVDDLADLMVSGDLTLVADDLAGTGDDAAEIDVVDVQTDTRTRSLSIAIPDVDELPLADHPVLTLPANRPFRLDVSVDGPDGSCEIGIGPLVVRPGEDRRVDLDAALALSVDPDRVRLGGSTEVTVTAVTCVGSAEGSLVDLAIEPTSPTGASLADNQLVLDQDGEATTTLAAGDDTAVYTLAADTTLVNGAQLVSASASTTVAVGETYDLDVAAVDGPESLYDAVDDFFTPGTPLGPSINGDGDVAFGALPVDLDRYGLFVSEPGDDPVDIADADDVSGLPIDASDIFVKGEPQFNDSGEVVFTTQETFGTNDIATIVTRSSGPGATDAVDLALGLSAFGATGERFEQVGRPTINVDGRVVFVATPQGATEVLAERQGDAVVEGPPLFGARPRLADDGTTVVRGSISRDCADFPGVCGPLQVLIDPIVLVGEGLLDTGGVVVAEGRVDGWQTIGDADISGPGDVIAFVADRDGARGLWIAVRRPDGSYQTPIAVAGPAASTSTLIDVDLDRPSVVQLERGADGPAGDRVILATRGTANANAGPANNGVHTIALDLVATGETAIPYFPRVQPAELVAQVGDAVQGRTIASLRLGDSLAVAADAAFDDDHWVAFFARTDDDRSMYVRARALPPPTAPLAGAAGGSPALPPLQQAGGLVAVLADTVARVVSEAVPAVAHAVTAWLPSVLIQDVPPGPSPTQPADGPHVAALTIDDDTPVAGVPVRVVNRSRALDGTPSFAVVDETRNDPRVLLEPLFLAPDAAGEVTYPSAATWTLEVGAPLITGPGATTAAFTVEAGRGPNRDPVASVDGPYLLGPGQQLDMRVTSSDPDGDSRTIAWDLNDDGATDSASSTVRLTGADVRSEICSGTCVLDQPYPVSVTVTDGQGGSTTVDTTVTVSALDDLTLRLGPAITTISQGTDGYAYAFVDAPDGSPNVPVVLSAENVPEGWQVFTPTGTVLTGGGSEVRVRVPAGTPDDTYTIDVVATSGTVTKRATLTVTTTFALIPQCEATVSGVVTAADGTPLEDARVDISGLSRTVFGRTDSAGQYETAVTLNRGFTTQSIRWDAGAAGFLVARGGQLVGAAPVYLTCGETTTIDVSLSPVPTADGLRARAVVGAANPVNPQRPVSTGIPLDGVAITASPGGTGESPADGVVQFDQQIELVDSNGNAARASISARKSGFWPLNRFPSFDPDDAGSVVDAGDLPMLEQCTGIAGGGRVVDQDGDPIEGARVRLESTFADDVLTDADGFFSFDTPQLLGEFNRATVAQFRAFTPPSFSPSDNDVEQSPIDGCGQRSEPVTMVLNRPEPQPADIDLTVRGVVSDADTGEPLPSVRVDIRATRDGVFAAGGRDTSDATGAYEDVITFQGIVPPLVADLRVRAAERGYFVEEVTVRVVGDDDVVVDVQLRPQQPVSLTGRVTDVETGEPIEGIRLRTSNGFTNVSTDSGADGTYAFDELFLLIQDDEEVARSASVEAFEPAVIGQDPQYYATDLRTTLFPDQPNILDVELLRICDGFSVSGIVLNAATGEPIEGARVTARGASALTDVNGRYELTDIDVSPLNRPLTTTVRASAEGFFDGSVEITGYCEAQITADFGVPPGGFGTVEGTVTDDATGNPLADVFVGASWGEVTATAQDGTYSFDTAPLQSDGGDRDWTITAERDGQRQNKPATVSSDAAAVVDFTFGEQDAPPVADSQSVQTEVDVPIELTLTGRDPDGDDVTFTVTTPPQNGDLSGTPPTLTYTPDAGVDGTDSFSFTATANGVVSEPAVVTIEVLVPVTNPPTIDLPQSVEVLAGQSVEIPVAGNDLDGDDVTFRLIGDAGGRALLADDEPGRATVTVDTTEDDAGSSFDVSVAVEAVDGTAQGTVRVDVTAPVVDRPPTARIDGPTQVDEGDQVTFDGSPSSDPEVTDLTYAWTLVDFDGSPVQTGTGATLDVTFADDFVGAVQLTVTDVSGNQGMVEQGVVAANVAPSPSIDTVTPDSDPTVGQQVSLLGSIADAGPDDTHTVTVEWGDGTSEPVIPSGRAWGASHTYRFQGEVTLTVRVSDDDGDDGAVSRVLTVAAAPDGESGENAAPTAQDVTVETTAGEPVDLRLEGDDPDGDPVTFALLTQPRDGSLSGTAPNLRYTPDDGFDGIDTFTYIASDNLLDSDPATVTVTVTAGDSSAAQPSVPDSAAPPVRWPSAGPTSGPSTSSSPPPAAGVGSDPHPEYLASTGGSVRQALLLAMVLIGAGAGIRMLRPRPRSG